jgi:hypothetical protein
MAAAVSSPESSPATYDYLLGLSNSLMRRDAEEFIAGVRKNLGISIYE